MREPPTLGTVSPDDFRRVRAVFEAALPRPISQRRTFIEQACGGNTVLVAEVERMLTAEAAHDRLLDRGWSAGAGSEPVTCSSCDAMLALTDRFCRTCGTPAHAVQGNEGRFCAGLDLSFERQVAIVAPEDAILSKLE